MKLRMIALTGLASIGLMAVFVPPTASATAFPSPPFKQCPAVGYDTSCEFLIVINPSGPVSILYDGTQGPYEGIDDTLIGVQNNSSQVIASIPVSGSWHLRFRRGRRLLKSQLN